MRLNDIPFYMARALILTILIETIVAFIIGLRKKDLINVILVNIMTNPLVFIVPLYINIRYGLFERNIALFIFEMFALFSEGFVYSKYLKYKKINPYVISLILNLSSYLIGVIINNFI